MVVTIPMVTFTSYQLPLVMIIQVTGLTFFTKLSFDSHKFFREAEALIWQYTQLCGQLGNEVGETNWQPDDLFNQDRILCVFFSVHDWESWCYYYYYCYYYYHDYYHC